MHCTKLISLWFVTGHGLLQGVHIPEALVHENHGGVERGGTQAEEDAPKIAAPALRQNAGDHAFTVTFAPKEEAFDFEKVQKFVEKICKKLQNEFNIELRG